MKKIYQELDDNFKEISNLIEGASVLTLARVRERIQEIVGNKNIIQSIKVLEEEEESNDFKRRKPILFSADKQEQEIKIQELEAEVRELKEKLAKATTKNTKKVGRRESLSEQKKAEIREIYKSGEMSMPKLAKKYRVSVGLIYKVIHSQEGSKGLS